MRIFGRYYDKKTLLIGVCCGLGLLIIPVVSQYVAKMVSWARNSVKKVTNTVVDSVNKLDTKASVSQAEK